MAERIKIDLSGLKVLRMLRLARILRIVKVVRFFSELRIMVNGVIGSARSLCWALLLILLVNFLFHCHQLEIFQGFDRIRFGFDGFQDVGGLGSAHGCTRRHAFFQQDTTGPSLAAFAAEIVVRNICFQMLIMMLHPCLFIIMIIKVIVIIRHHHDGHCVCVIVIIVGSSIMQHPHRHVHDHQRSS